MNSKQAKEIPIESFLSQVGHKPTKMKGSDLWYTSPLREENSASFKVNQALNTWYDFGLGKGGNILDLVCEMFNEDIRGALYRLESSKFSKVTKNHVNQKNLNLQEKSYIKLIETKDLDYFPLKNYLKERSIDIDIAKHYTKEVHFKLTKQGKLQVAVGFKNDKGYYEYRNKLIKGLIGKNKAITSINIENTPLVFVFEGFIDFLSFATNFKFQFDIDKFSNMGFIILNSVSLKSKARNIINESTNIKTAKMYLDNDNAGNETQEYFEEQLDCKCVDMRPNYKNFEDYNDYWQKNGAC